MEIENRHGEKVPIKCLLDTGTSSTLILRDYVKKGRAKSYKGKRTKWSTLGGQFSTNRKALLDFKFPELSNSKTVTWICHVDDKTSPERACYDMILGMDLMTHIGMFVDTERKTVRWKTHEIPLKQRGDLMSKKTVSTLYHMSKEIDVLKEAEARQTRILDADYSAQDIDTFVRGLNHLTYEKQTLLKETLNRHKSLFQGGLGTLNIKPIHLEIKKDAKPYHARPFPIPKSLEEQQKGKWTD